MQPLFALADPEKAGDLMKQYRFMIFPEDRFDDVKYHKKAADMFEKMRLVDMRVRVQ